jgi:cyclophilin family peptidyl-prolyl cis-trans isomerase
VTVRRVLAAAALACFGAMAHAQPQSAGPPTIVVETAKGTFSFVTFPSEAPATVAHIVALVKSGFYDGQRVHRAIPDFVVQFGDPRSRDPGSRELWGRGAGAASGTPVGTVEMSRKRLHVTGAVALSHPGTPAQGDSQIYVTLAPRPDLDGQYVVFGQVTSGDDVPASLQVGDVIVRMYVTP